MSDFSTRLRKLRAQKNITQKRAAEGIGLSERLYQSYELAEKEPSLGNIIKLADFFDVSADYLLGRSEKQK